ncbi:hypothetical protein G5B35_24055 [Parapusillimonas sp. SGNA-6]|uniref:hypothetical protein n=1 Tax=Parapedobacter sp. SGR-10 TaxID=2710879 RepID=UPI0013CFDC75|nr:hypothetical protein [Parapedobacter sp. SGR-10]NGF57655.1 hypothetical protein [Parapedobacter sp. SGR-10]NGM90376.1 hypothetical protein [Parapusillimonas sp. SGNA-6]
MKRFFIFIFLMVSITDVICQNTDSILVSSGSTRIIYLLISDKNIEDRKRAGIDCHFIYPLLILNGLIIREEEKVNCFRNQFEFTNIKSTKRITKAEAEKKGIPNVPKDGVLFVTTKRGYYFDYSCE